MKNTTRFERSGQFWMRAYPRRWRETFGDDLLAVLTDVTDPGAARVPAAEALQIVRAGWACRWREHPPLWNWLLYRFLGFHLPQGYRLWVRDDLRGRFWLVRDAMYPILVVFLILFFSNGFQLPTEFSLVLLLGLGVVSVIGFLTRRPRMRSAWYRFVETEPPPEFWTDRARARARRNRVA